MKSLNRPAVVLARAALLVVATVIGCSSHNRGETVGQTQEMLTCISAEAADSAQAWEINKAYAVGNLVEFRGQIYQCTIAHTSQADWAPNVATSLWLSPPPCFSTAWQTQTGYNTGDVVEFDGRLYKAIQAHTSQAEWAPDLTPALWELLPLQDTKPSCPGYAPSVFTVPEKPRVKAAEVGTIGGSFAVSNAGGATYTMPILVPPGRAGVQPSVALGYSSDSGNGLAGIGFAISGLSTIHRCGGNAVDDGVSREVRYDRRDNFCLDGSRLALVAGVHGKDGAEYRTTPDTFSRIVAFVDPAHSFYGGPTSFKVWTKDGRILEYGGRAGSADEPSARIMADNGAVRIWALSRVSDRSGNYFAVHYNQTTNPSFDACNNTCASGARCVRGQCAQRCTGSSDQCRALDTPVQTSDGCFCVMPDDAGDTPQTEPPPYTTEWSPDEIRYTGHEPSSTLPTRRIKFIYDARPDLIQAHSRGMTLTISQRLIGLLAIQGTDNVVVREYDLQYEPSTSHATGRSRLQSVTEIGFPNDPALRTCKPATVFHWQDSSIGQNQSGYRAFAPEFFKTAQVKFFSDYIYADFDGDGRDDVYDPGSGQAAFSLGVPGVFDPGPNQLSQAFASGFITWLPAQPLPPTRLIPIDWNGDQRTDLLLNQFPDVDDNFQVFVSTTDANGNLKFNQVDTGLPNTATSHFADVNGDGTLDVIKCQVSDDGTHRLYTAFLFDRIAHTFLTTGEVLASSFDLTKDCGTERFSSLDSNGDGSSDLIVGEELAIRVGPGNWKTMRTNLPANAEGIRILDLNGDGLHDVLIRLPDGTLQLALNQGVAAMDLGAVPDLTAKNKAKSITCEV